MPGPRGGPHRFVTTRWSLVLAAGRPGSAEAAAALATLCEAYWFPVYAFVRRSGHSEEDARDLTQAFFARMLEKHDVRAADPARGRFRSFLLASVRHFLINQHDAAMAQKRGGGAPHLSLEFDDGERRYEREPAHSDTPERLFERRWALATLDIAIARVGGQHHADGRGPLFDALRPFLAGSEPSSYETLARQFDTTEGALRVAVHRLRRAFRESLREVILATVERPEDIEDELRYLLRVVSG